jgi:class 3 adenylate cyclase
MAWTYEKSRDRVKARWDRRSDLDISVEKLGRQMELANITLPKSKRVRGVHLYATVAGTGQIDVLTDNTAAAGSIRILGAWLAEASRIATALEVPVIAAQGARIHLLNYRPIDDDKKLARDAVLLAAALRRMTVGALNSQLDTVAMLNCRTGLDLGETVGTRGGTGGDSEVLFLGSPANRAAKLLGTRKIVVSARLYDALDGVLDLTAEEIEDQDAWALSMTDDAHDAAIDKFGFAWSVKKSTDRLTEDLEKWPVERCKVGGATETLKFDSLSRSSSKLIEAAVLIADIDGFSAYIESFEDDDEKRDAIVALDMIRYELREVLRNDYSGGVRVQYQGDNIVGLVHMPGKATTKVAERALDIAAGMQASMQHTLSEIVPEANKLTVTVGVALADTLATQLGPRGRRDAMVVGPAVTKADRISAALDGTEVGFSKHAYEALSEHLQASFVWSSSAQAWVAADLPADKLDLIKEAHERELAAAQEARIYPPDAQGRSRIGPATGATPSGASDVRVVKPYSR